MSGMTGIIGQGAHEDHRRALSAMVDCMRHDPRHVARTYENEALGLWVGWVEDTDRPGPGTPVWNATDDVCLIFAGEDFADRPRTDLLRLYEELGLGFLEALNGRFSGLVVDLRRSQVSLFNDRYGLKRVYYHETPRALYFASEAKSLLRVLPDTRRADPESLGEFFACGCALQDRTLFAGVSLLPGGSLWTATGGAPPRHGAYFDTERWEAQPRLSREEFYAALRAAFPRLLPRYVRPGEQVALSLTGGLDSRMILAWAPPDWQSMPCYTFAGAYRDPADATLARRVAGIGQHPHRVIRLDHGFFPEFPTLAERAVCLSDGAMDVSGAVDLYVNRHARAIAPIRLTGNYGSEVLRGNVAFKPIALRDDVFEPELARSLATAARTYATERRGRRLSFIVFKQVPWHHYGRLAVEESQLSVRSPYLDNDLVALLYRAPDEALADDLASLRLVADGNPALTTVGTDRGRTWGAPSLASRARRWYQDFTFKAEYAYDYGMPGWLARVDRSLRPLRVERHVLGRHKFAHFRVWYRDRLAPYVKDVLLDPRTLRRPYLRGARVEDLVRGHTTGRRNFTLEIHRLLTIELLQRQLIERA